MTTFLVKISDREYHVDVIGEHVRVNGRSYQARLTPINQNGHFLLKTETDQREVHIQSTGQDAFMATIASRYYQIQVERNHRNPARVKPQNQGELKAPMPAKVIAVRVKPGEQVVIGQTVLLLESMKMQMEIKSPISGIVQVVDVQENGQVEKGQQLITILPATS